MTELGFQVLCYKQGDLIILFLNQTRSFTFIYLLVRRYGTAKEQLDNTIKLLFFGNVEFKWTELCSSFFNQTTLCSQALLLYHLSLLRSVKAALPSLRPFSSQSWGWLTLWEFLNLCVFYLPSNLFIITLKINVHLLLICVLNHLQFKPKGKQTHK